MHPTHLNFTELRTPYRRYARCIVCVTLSRYVHCVCYSLPRIVCVTLSLYVHCVCHSLPLRALCVSLSPSVCVSLSPSLCVSLSPSVCVSLSPSHYELYAWV